MGSQEGRHSDREGGQRVPGCPFRGGGGHTLSRHCRRVTRAVTCAVTWARPGGVRRLPTLAPEEPLDTPSLTDPGRPCCSAVRAVVGAPLVSREAAPQRMAGPSSRVPAQTAGRPLTPCPPPSPLLPSGCAPPCRPARWNSAAGRACLEPCPPGSCEILSQLVESCVLCGAPPPPGFLPTLAGGRGPSRKEGVAPMLCPRLALGSASWTRWVHSAGQGLGACSRMEAHCGEGSCAVVWPGFG